MSWNRKRLSSAKTGSGQADETDIENDKDCVFAGERGLDEHADAVPFPLRAVDEFELHCGVALR